MKLRTLLITLALSISLVSTGAWAKTHPKHCDAHKTAAAHDCAKHCASHPGAKSGACAKHCSSETTAKAHVCDTPHCDSHLAAAAKNCSTVNCSTHTGAAAHNCSAEHCAKHGGNMAEVGAVGWQFDRKSYFAFPASQMNFDKAFELGIEAGADDVVDGGDTVEIFAPVEAFKTLADALHKANVHPDESGLRMIPKQEIELDVESTLKFMKMVEAIEELDDVQDVFHNVKVSAEALAALEAA